MGTNNGEKSKKVGKSGPGLGNNEINASVLVFSGFLVVGLDVVNLPKRICTLISSPGWQKEPSSLLSVTLNWQNSFGVQMAKLSS